MTRATLAINVVIGTAAMFMVGGGILTHGVPVVHHWIESVSQSIGGISWLMPTLLNSAVIAAIFSYTFIIVLLQFV